MYAFQISTGRAGVDIASCGDMTAQSSRGCAARDLSRTLVAAGAEDAPIEAMRGDRVSYRVRSLHAFARTALVENPKLKAVAYRDVAAAFKLRLPARGELLGGDDEQPRLDNPLDWSAPLAGAEHT